MKCKVKSAATVSRNMPQRSKDGAEAPRIVPYESECATLLALDIRCSCGISKYPPAEPGAL